MVDFWDSFFRMASALLLVLALIAGLELPISRLVINQASSLTAGGSLTKLFVAQLSVAVTEKGASSVAVWLTMAASAGRNSSRAAR